MKILFFIEAFGFGGKERRLMELIHYLKQNTDYELGMVLTESRVHFEMIHELKVPIKIIERKILKRDPRVFSEFIKFCREFKPDIIHTWGFMTTFYAIPAKILLKVPLISSMITVARREFPKASLNNLFFKISCKFSDAIISNSKAGLRAFNVNGSKAKVIYNGVRLERFRQDFRPIEMRESLGIKTVYVVIMVATFSRFKDYDLFLDIAKEAARSRPDITFVGVGGGPDWNRINDRMVSEKIDNVVLTGRRSDIEHLIYAADIGLLCTFSEGISNSIIEYMALRKPVISTDLNGGSRELIDDGETGFCIKRDLREAVATISFLTDDEKMRQSMGEKAEVRIRSLFSVERMGKEFEELYNEFI